MIFLRELEQPQTSKQGYPSVQCRRPLYIQALVQQRSTPAQCWEHTCPACICSVGAAGAMPVLSSRGQVGALCVSIPLLHPLGEEGGRNSDWPRSCSQGHEGAPVCVCRRGSLLGIGQAAALGPWGVTKVRFDTGSFSGVRCLHSSSPELWGAGQAGRGVGGRRGEVSPTLPGTAPRLLTLQAVVLGAPG